ncbi:N-glycosidase R617 [Paramyrothecium foliicola]|nr:N-glycosidase R617 [Paramyrothecium foliicola]
MQPSILRHMMESRGKASTRRPLATPGSSSKNIYQKSQERNDGPVFFFKPNESHGEFCQWYPSTFTVSKVEMSRIIGHPIDQDDPEGWQPIYFNCAEQFMMYCKAGCFHDTETQRLVLATHDPKEQKRLARQTRGFQADKWDEVKSPVVVAGNLAKFGQNQRLKQVLLDTGERLLAEAASEDRVWGIGYTAKEAEMHRDQQKWGENRLGKALMEVRERLRPGQSGVT